VTVRVFAPHASSQMLVEYSSLASELYHHIFCDIFCFCFPLLCLSSQINAGPLALSIPAQQVTNPGYSGVFAAPTLLVDTLSIAKFGAIIITPAPLGTAATTTLTPHSLLAGTDMAPVLRVTLTNALPASGALVIAVPAASFTVVAAPMLSASVNSSTGSVTANATANEITIGGMGALAAGSVLTFTFAAFAAASATASSTPSAAFTVSTVLGSGAVVDTIALAGFPIGVASTPSLSMSTTWPSLASSFAISLSGTADQMQTIIAAKL
jgi:hypothetical protein